jgi:hypothetical protein
LLAQTALIASRSTKITIARPHRLARSPYIEWHYSLGTSKSSHSDSRVHAA